MKFQLGKLGFTGLFVAFFLFLLVLPSQAATEPTGSAAQKETQPPEVEVSFDSPTQVIQKYTEELRDIIEPEKEKPKKVDLKKEAKIAEKVRQFFDFYGLARMSLGHHWGKLTKKERDEFSDLFVSLIEDSYLRRSRDLVGNYEIKYGKEEVKGQRAKVFVSVMQEDADVDIVYELHRNPKSWMIFNIVFDGVDLIRNYQTQFNHIIGKETFAGLLKKLRKKKKKAKEEIVF